MHFEYPMLFNPPKTMPDISWRGKMRDGLVENNQPLPTLSNLWLACLNLNQEVIFPFGSSANTMSARCLPLP